MTQSLFRGVWLAAVLVSAPTAERTLAAQSLNAAAAPKPAATSTGGTTADFAWLTGTWEGSFAASPDLAAQLTFQAPAAGTITGVMRLRQGDKLLVVELISMVDTPRGVEMRFRHFNGALDALETTFKQTMVLKTAEPTKYTFENLVEFDKALMSTQPRVSSWTRRGADEMVAHSDILGSDGKPAVIEVNYRRSGARPH